MYIIRKATCSLTGLLNGHSEACSRTVLPVHYSWYSSTGRPEASESRLDCGCPSTCSRARVVSVCASEAKHEPGSVHWQHGRHFRFVRGSRPPRVAFVNAYRDMSSLRVLDLVKPFGAFLPEIISPERKPTFQTRITWTGK